jgi:hypothetical protein
MSKKKVIFVVALLSIASIVLTVLKIKKDISVNVEDEDVQIGI